MERIYENETFKKLKGYMNEKEFNKVYNKADNLMDDISFLNEMTSRMKKDNGYNFTVVPIRNDCYRGIVPAIFANILLDGCHVDKETLYKYYNLEQAVWIDHVLKNYLPCSQYDKKFVDEIEEMINTFVPRVKMSRMAGSHGELDSLWFVFKKQEY